MIDYFTIIQIQYILLVCIYLIEKLYFKYILNKDIILNKLIYLNYDKINSLYILYLTFNIEIHTIQSKDKRNIFIYFNKNKISNVIIKNEKIINNKIFIILSLEYLDKYNFINLLEIYNCGIIAHTSMLFKHFYNYIGDRRNVYNHLII